MSSNEAIIQEQINVLIKTQLQDNGTELTINYYIL